ncbi:MFS transporter, partial [bacterium]|nr:MFS transporter [bacterium]
YQSGHIDILSGCMASIADLSEDEKVRGKNFSMVTALFGVSWVCAMILGGYIGNPRVMGHFGPVFAFLFSAGLSLLTVVALLFMFRDTTPPHPETKFRFGQGIINIKETLMLKPTRIFFAIYFAWSLGWVIAVQWYPSFSMEVFGADVYEFTTWFMIMGITWTLGAFFAKHFLFPRYSTLTVGTIGFMVMTLCLLVMQFISAFALFSILFCIAAFFAVFAMSASLNLISIAAPKEVQGKIMGLSQSAQSIAFVMVSTIAFLVSIYTISILFYFAAGISAVGLGLLVFKQAKRA